MNNLKNSALQAVKGMCDFIPPQSRRLREVEQCCHTVLKNYGYAEVWTPIVEYTPLFSRSIGDDTDIVEKEMYTFEDRDGRFLTLRPEGTAGVVRAFIEHGLAQSEPITHWYYLGPMFRHERAQRGRYRQFFQLGVEALGGAEPGIDAEVIALAVDLISALGLQELAVHLNTLGCPECRPAYRQALLAYLTPHENQLCVDCQRRFRQNPLRVLDCKVSRCIEIASKAPTSLDLACAACRQHWDGVLADLDLWGVAYQIDHKLVRGLDYYTRTTFELICSSGNLGSQNTLAGGGRYDGLVATLGGPPTPAVGFAMGLERLLLALGEEKPPLASLVQIYCVSRDTSTRRTLIPLVHTLRQQGIAVEMDHRGASIKSQMKRADRLGCQLAIIIGEEEKARNVLLLRDMKTSQQEEIPFSEALSQIVQRFRF